MTLDEIRVNFHGLAPDARLEWPWVIPHGVESQAHIRWRIDQFMEDLPLTSNGENLLLIGHGDSVSALKQYFFVITLAPFDACDHQFSDEKIEQLAEMLNGFSVHNVLIGTHVPREGACPRPADEGIYLDKNPKLMEVLKNSAKKIYWTGGHFHYPPEPIDMNANPCAFMGGCFAFDDTKRSYLRKLKFHQTIEISDLFL